MDKKRAVAVTAVGLTIAGSMAVVPAQGTPLKNGSGGEPTRRALSVELIGQVQNSAPGVSPATSRQYGYISQMGGVPVFTGEPNESTALFTFYTDTTTNQVLTNGPLRVIDRSGTITIYKDAVPNGTFADPNSFRDGAPILVAELRQQVIVDTTTGAFTARNLNTITAIHPFQGPNGAALLGTPGDPFRTIITGHLNASPSPSAYMAGYTING